MNYTYREIGIGFIAAILIFGVSSCSQPNLSSEEHALKVIAQYPADSFEYFVTQANYPKSNRTYINEKLLKKATSVSPIYISVSQQRGRFYVEGQVAADWPVSTGTKNYPTPIGRYRVREKIVDKASTLWGRLYDANGKIINSNADSRKVTIPEGGKFVGAPMPYWQRMTWDGVGMHVGSITPGCSLSHGCIRMPRIAAEKIFPLTTIDETRIHVISGVESEFPYQARISMHANQIVDNYRKYAKSYAMQHGADEDVELTEEFELSQKMLSDQLPSEADLEHIEINKAALYESAIHPAATSRSIPTATTER